MNDGKEKWKKLLRVSSIFLSIILSASHTRAILLKGNVLGSVTFFWPILDYRPARTSLQHAFYRHGLQLANFSSTNCKCHIWYHLPIKNVVNFISLVHFIFVSLFLFSSDLRKSFLNFTGENTDKNSKSLFRRRFENKFLVTVKQNPPSFDSVT